MNFVTGYALNRCKSRIPNVQWICREKDLSFLLRIKEREGIIWHKAELGSLMLQMRWVLVQRQFQM